MFPEITSVRQTSEFGICDVARVKEIVCAALHAEFDPANLPQRNQPLPGALAQLEENIWRAEEDAHL